MLWSRIVIFLALSGSLLVGSHMKARATQLLSPEQSNQVATVRAMRWLARTFLLFYVGAALVILVALGVPVLPINFYVLVVVAASVAVWAHVSYFRKLRALGLPPAYLDAVRHSRVVVYCALLVIMAIIMYEGMRSG